MKCGEGLALFGLLMSVSQHPNLIDIEIAVQGEGGGLLGLFQKSLAASSIVAACECPSRATLCGIQRNVSFMKEKKKRIKGSIFDLSSPLHRAWFSFPPFAVCFICCLGCGGCLLINERRRGNTEYIQHVLLFVRHF